MRYILLLLLFTANIAHGQSYINFAQSPRTTDTARTLLNLLVNGYVRLPSYASADSNKVLGVTSNGMLVLRTKGTGGGGGSGTVTNVSTGYGMLGGPITTAGTVRVDTFTVANRRYVDSGLANIPASFDTTHIYAALSDSMQTVRTDFVPYTNALQDVDLGTKGITAQWLMSDTVQSNTGTLHLHGSGGTGILIGSSGSLLFDHYPTVVAGDSVLTTNSAGALQQYNLKGKLGNYQLYSDTTTWDATRSWVGLQIPSLTGYVPYTGATTNVNLGTHNIIPNSVQFSLTPTGTLTGIGTMYWDATNETVSMPLNNEVTLQVGQETHIRARNNTGVQINNGQAVYINDAQGNNPTIALANAKVLTTAFLVGIATENIPDNTTGFVTTMGTVSGINTSGYNDGDILYLDTVAGQITNVPAKHPYYTVMLGEALNSTNNGKIFVHAEEPIACDTTLSGNSNRVAPTQAAVKAAVGTKQNYSDTSTFDATRAWVNGRGFGTGTVTSVAAANGYGLTISGSPVTGTGTITATVDSSLIATRLRVKKQIDSVAALGGGGGPAKLKAVAPVTLTAGTGDTLVISISPNTTSTITEATAFTYSGANGLIQKITMNNALDTVTVDTATLVEGVTYELRVIQGAGGNKILHWANTGTLFQGGTTATGKPYQDIGAAEISRYFIQKSNALLFVNPVVNNRN